MSRPHEETWTGQDNWVAAGDGGVVFEIHLPPGVERDAYRALCGCRTA